MWKYHILLEYYFQCPNYYYITVFAYSWQPEFCYGKSNYYGCEHPNSLWNEVFTVHGLWPQYQAGGYPRYV